MVLILLFGLSKKGIVKTECSKILNIFGTRIVESMKVIASDKKNTSTNSGGRHYRNL